MLRMRPARFAGRAFLPLLGTAWLIGWIMGDRETPWVWFYFIPAPFILAAGLLDLFVCRHAPFRWRTALVIGLTLLAAVKTALRDTHWNRPRVDAPAGAIRIVHWNVAHTPFGLFPMFKQLRADRPDLVVLSESAHGRYWSDWSNTELGLPYAFHDQGMTLLSRFDFEPQGTIRLPNARAWWARIELPDGPLDLVLCDLLSHPRLNLRAALDPLAQWVEQRDAAIPLLVVGDFNTPRDARSWGPLRARLRHAYEVAGRGWPYSWPLPFPVYALDHAWVSDKITVHGYRLRSAAISDHRRQILTIGIDRKTASSTE